MRLFIGGIIGLVLGLLLYLTTAIILGVGVPGFLISILFGLLPFLTSFTPGAWIVITVFTVVIVNIFSYVIATIALITPTATTPSGALPVSPAEEFMRGLIIGLTAGLNFGIWALIVPLIGFFIGLYVGLLCFLAVITLFSRNLVYQGFLGWSSWLMPMSYLVTPLGILLFVINLPFAITAFGPGAVRLDHLTGTIETTGGLVGITGIRGGGFNLGNFTFLSPALGVPLSGIQTPFGGPGLSAHETGHTLTVAAFGGVFGWINAIDENVPPFKRSNLAYGELVPESHFPRAFLPHVRVWS